MKLGAKQLIDKYLGKVLLAFNLALVRGLGFILRRDHTLEKPPGNIVIIKILGLGSVFMALDALHSLRQTYPSTRMTLICGKGIKDGIAPLNLFDRILVIDDSSFSGMAGSSLSVLLKCWRMKNLWTIDLEVYSTLTTIFASWTMALNRFGFELNKVNFRHYLNTHHVYFNQFTHVEENYKALVKVAGVSNFSPFVFKHPTSAVNNERKYIAINNTCSELGGNLRKLTKPVLQQICSHILEHTGLHIAFTGAPGDKKETDLFISEYLHNDPRVRNTAGALDFPGYYRFLQNECVMMLSIDSAPLHIARKIGLPTISAWGPINPQQRIVHRQDNKGKDLVHYLGVPCSPCIHLTEIVPRGGNNICMKNMNAEDINAMIDQQLMQITR